MDRKLNKKHIFLLVFSLVILQGVFCQNKYNIDYYGIVATEIDQNMSKMTSDLYYTQLCEINNFVVSDKRITNSIEQVPSSDSLSVQNLSFYAVINKKDDTGKWITTLTLFDPTDKSRQTKTSEYDSYYKILMEPKSFLQASIKDLIENKVPEISGTTELTKFDFPPEPKGSIISTEFLSGTWAGEDNIDKIVIMRGGRGFVIFTNGASMNILVELVSSGGEKKVVITQNSRANASYFPELSRQLALTEAVNAKPIKWSFDISNNDTLTGTKNTLIEKEGAAVQTDLSVTWKRKS